MSSNIRENFNPRKKWGDALRVIRATNKIRSASNGGNNGDQMSLSLSSDSEGADGFKTAESDDDLHSPRRKIDLGGGGAAVVPEGKEVASGMSKLAVN